MKNSFLVILALVTTKTFSQSISGKIYDGSSKTVSNANVLLLRAEDSALVKGAATNTSGSYSFNNIKPGSYLLQATNVGYKPVFSKRFNIAKGQNLDMPSLTLIAEAGELNEVTVTGKRPFIEQKIDRTVVNVGNSIIASGSTALEVLEKAPGVTVDRQNDQISLRGKEGVIVQIDGKQTYLPTADVVAMLRSMPSDNIDRIELITNPSSKYDAAGNAGIIDIRLKKNNNIGTNGSLSASFGSGRYGRKRGNLQINHRTLRYNFFANYTANHDGTYWDFDIERRQGDNGKKNIINSLSFIRMKDKGQNIKTGVDYFLSKRTTIGVVWTAFWTRFSERSPAHTIFTKEESDDPYKHTLSDKSILTITSNHLGNFNFQHSFRKKNAQISADFDVARFRRDYTNALFTSTLVPKAPAQPVEGLHTQMPTSINIVTFKIDYNQQIGASWKMESGFKSSSVHSDNDVVLKTGNDGTLEKDTSLSNHFKYTEYVNAAYVNVSGKVGKLNNVVAGLRAEHTHSIGNSLTLNNVVDRNYLNIFPSVFLSRTIDKKNVLTFSYSYRIDRPNYQSLNPARSYLDPFTYSSGNAFLTPQYTHSLELKHGFKEKIFTSLAVSLIRDLQFYLIQPLDDITTRRMPENIGSSQAYSMTISFPLRVMRGWDFQGTLMGNYSVFDYAYKGSPIRAQQAGGRFNGTNVFLLGKGWTGEVAGWIRTPAVYVIQHTPWLGSLDAGLQKVLSRKWKMKLSVQDMLHTNQIRFRIDVPGFKSRGSIAMDTRMAMLNVTYSFGNQQLKTARERRTAAEDELQRAR